MYSIPMRYSMMAPDSQRVMPEFGSSIAGTLKPVIGSVTFALAKTWKVTNIPAIYVDCLKRRLLHVRHLDEFVFIFETEFFEDDGHFPRVRPGSVRVENDWLRHDALGICFQTMN